VPDIELVVTDLDGTLWPGGDDERPHHATLEAWRELDRRGVTVVVATGRRVSGARRALGAIGRAPCAVALNGAIGVDLSDRSCFHRHHHSVDGATAVLAAFRAHGLDPCVYVEDPDVDVFVSDAPSTSAIHLQTLAGRARRADLDEIVATVPVLSFSVFGHPTALLDQVAGAVAHTAKACVITSPFGAEYGIDVAAPGLSKWSGVVAYCDAFGVDPARVLAIGDEVNDVELVANASIGVAMADGHPDAIAAADHVVPPTAEGGWAAILDLLDLA
jgi:hydroxymethylpyrimidine pyrophosphatase-like HAD family hydrolase